MIDDQSTIDQRCFESFREIKLGPDAELGAILVAGTHILSAPAIMNTHKAIVRSHITAYIDAARIILFNGAMPENEIQLAPSLVHEPEVYDEYLHKMLFEWYGDIDRVTIISGDRRITQKILEAPNLHDIVSVTGGEIRDKIPIPPIFVPIEHYPHFKASYHAEGHNPKEVRIYASNPTRIEDMRVPRICHYCEQGLQDGDVVNVNYKQRGKVVDVLHTILDSLLEIGDGVSPCREMSMLTGKTGGGGYNGVYYQGTVYSFEGVIDEAEFELNEARTAHKVTNIDALAFKLKPLTEG